MNKKHPDSSYENELQDLRQISVVHRLSHRITMVSILIPCLFCAILLFAYLDLRDRITQIQTTGARDVETFSEDIVSKIESLSYQHETLDSSLTGELAAIEKSFALFKQGRKKSEQAIDNLIESKTDKKAFSALKKDIAKDNESLEKLSKELNRQLDEVANALAALGNNLQGQEREMAEVYEYIDAIHKESQKQGAVIRHLSASKVDKEAFDHSLKKERAGYLEEMVLLEKKIMTVKEAISWIEKRIDAIETSYGLPESKSPQPQEKPVSETTDSSSLTVPDNILEQEITQ
jgi:chromosome segregation ATPase